MMWEGPAKLDIQIKSDHYGPSLEKNFPLLFHYEEKIFVLAWFFVKTSSTS